MIDIITPSDKQWDHFVRQQSHAHFLQLAAWGTHKAAFGWIYDRVALAKNDQIIGGAQILFRPFPLKLGTMAYIAMGPYLTDTQYKNELWKAIHDCTKQKRATFLKWEPGVSLDEALPNFNKLGFRSSLQTIQPTRTLLMDISDSNDIIMGRMNQGTRRKIRQSYKKDIHYYEGGRTDVEKFNTIIQITGSRNEFGVHTPEYYELAYDLFVEQGDGRLILAEHEGNILAGIMVFGLGSTAWYLYGASSNTKRNFMATYGIQWEAIQWAKRQGYRYYDLWGIPDEDEAILEAQFQERSDGLWGVYGFKRGWGGQVVRSAGAWDKVYNPMVYYPYKVALHLRV